ncbi:hypothetical protein SAICODRAFT_29180 [Saitoella complicata NRRL Y-17804]|nr:uncharacterized protein SAICODRAFT_29180 [Saitoella complicata NRRL Y-17804]ODQ54968.1 hypothetical protein SAICODRAFT_29180 [Saitoella complicata NRRL Y-17804]
MPSATAQSTAVSAVSSATTFLTSATPVSSGSVMSSSSSIPTTTYKNTLGGTPVSTTNSSSNTTSKSGDSTLINWYFLLLLAIILIAICAAFLYRRSKRGKRTQQATRGRDALQTDLIALGRRRRTESICEEGESIEALPVYTPPVEGREGELESREGGGAQPLLGGVVVEEMTRPAPIATRVSSFGGIQPPRYDEAMDSSGGVPTR